MAASMLALSFLVLVIAWKSFERNLGIRLGDAPESGKTIPGPFHSLIEDIKRITGGEEPLLIETSGAKQEMRGGWIELIFPMAREIRRVVLYNAGEIQTWLKEILKLLMGALR